MSNEPIEQSQLEVVPASALELMQRAEVDVQISTAHKYPRSMSMFKRRALDMALIDEETAASCIYCRPVGKKNGKPEYAEGLSVRLAEIVGASYGNIRVGSMIIEQTPRVVKARGFAHDLESNFASTSEVVEPTVTKDGNPYSENMRAVVAKAALSKAWRDALFKVVPRALCKPIEFEVRKLAAGDAKSLGLRRSKVMEWVNKLGIEPRRVFDALGIAGEADLTSEHLITLTGLRTSIKDGDTTIDDAFPDKVQPPKFEKAASAQPVKEAEAVTVSEPQPEPPKTKEPNPIEALTEYILKDCQATFDLFQKMIIRTGWDPKAADWTGFDDVSVATAKRLMNARRGLLIEVGKEVQLASA